MSDRDTDNTPLFQNMDEQERIYAPQEVPGADIPADERDYGSDTGESASDDNVVVPALGVVPGAGGITGASGGSVGGATGGVLPVIPMDNELDPDERREVRNEERERL